MCRLLWYYALSDSHGLRLALFQPPFLSPPRAGANCLAAAVAAGEPVKLDAITSIATSLGALQCSPTALKLFQQHKGECAMVTDEQAVRACAQMLSHHRVLVEPACGAAIAAALHEPQRSRLSDLESVVIVVCGGSGVDFTIMEQWRADGLWE